MPPQRVPETRCDHILMKNVILARIWRNWLRNRNIRQVLCEPGRESPAGLVPLLEQRQLDPQDGGLDRVEAGRRTDHVVSVAGSLAVRAQQPDPICQQFAVGGDRAAVAPRPEVLRRIEPEAADVSDRSDGPFAIPRPVRLRTL